MANTRKTKRDSDQVDKLIAEVEKLTANGMSVNKACAKVGLQNTVWYFRKRKEEAERLASSQKASQNLAKYSNTRSSSSSNYENKDIEALTQEYRELENRLNAIKLQIAEKVMSKSLTLEK